MYESPELFEIGDVETLTLGKFHGDWPDGLPLLWTWVRVTIEDDEIDTSAQ